MDVDRGCGTANVAIDAIGCARPGARQFDGKAREGLVHVPLAGDEAAVAVDEG